MVSIGTPLALSATRVLLLGAGELGKEVAIEFQRLAAEELGLPTSPYRFAESEQGLKVVIKSSGDTTSPTFSNLDQVLSVANTELRLFGKPELHGARRMGVVLASAESAELAREVAMESAGKAAFIG